MSATASDELLTHLVRQGYTDDEILDTVARSGSSWSSSGPYVAAPAPSLREQHRIRDRLAAIRLREGIPDPTARVVDPIPTRSAPLVAECRKAIAKLRRDRIRVTVTAVATAAGIERETVSGYIKHGWVDLTDS